MTESVSVATFITETSTTDHASSSIAEAAQELSENISEVTLRNMQVALCTKLVVTVVVLIYIIILLSFYYNNK